MSLAQLAIAWMLQNPLIPSVIAGVTKMEQLEDNVKAAQVELSEDDLDQIDEILKDAQGS
jgi:aryl-alcohol dehydrogenase-like predicted oxidoreductase